MRGLPLAGSRTSLAAVLVREDLDDASQAARGAQIHRDDPAGRDIAAKDVTVKEIIRLVFGGISRLAGHLQSAFDPAGGTPHVDIFDQRHGESPIESI